MAGWMAGWVGGWTEEDACLAPPHLTCSSRFLGRQRGGVGCTDLPRVQGWACRPTCHPLCPELPSLKPKPCPAAFPDPQIPLPELPEERQAVLLAELEHRAVLSPQALPSAIFYTFINTHQSLNTVAFTSDAAVVAAGFSDASLRVYDMAAAAAARAGGGGGGVVGGGSSGAGSSAQAAAAAGGRQGVATLCGHSGPVYAADFSPDDQLLLTASADGTGAGLPCPVCCCCCWLLLLLSSA